MVQYTKKAIAESFLQLLNERPFDKISVVDIAEKCGINRNTFYYYYTDVFALVDDVFRMETQRIIDQDLKVTNWQDAFMQGTSFALQNRRAIYHLYNSTNRDRLVTYLYDVTISGMTSFVSSQAEGLDVDERDMSALSEFYTAALMGLGTKWLQDNMKEDVDDFVSRIARLLEGNIPSSLVRCARSKTQDKN